MSFYQDLDHDLDALFADEPFVDAVITRAGSETFDPRQRKTVRGTDITLSCRAVSETVERRALDGTTSTSTVITLNIEPQSGDKITLGTSTWRVSDVSSEAPAGVPLVFYATVAR